MKIIFVCTANRDRSPCAEIIFRETHPQHEYKSCGINRYSTTKYNSQHINGKLCEWADVIVCMEKVHANYIVTKIEKKYLSKIVVLDLGDTESFMSDQLKNILREKMKEKLSYLNF